MESFEVLDVHHHVGDAFSALGGPLDPTPDLTPEAFRQQELVSRLEIMDRGGVEQAVVIPGHGYLRTNGLADTQAQNDLIAAYRDAMPARFPAAVGIVEPRDGAASLDELDRCKHELGLAGISFHTRFQGVSLSSRWIHAYCERLAELDMVPVIHAMNETPEEALWKLAELARAIPETQFLALDPFSSFEAWPQCAFVAEIAPNVVFDTSLAYNFDFIEQFVAEFGADRVVFGTDLYSYPVGRRISHILEQIVASDLTDKEKTAILAGNAWRLFGLS